MRSPCPTHRLDLTGSVRSDRLRDAATNQDGSVASPSEDAAFPGSSAWFGDWIQAPTTSKPPAKDGRRGIKAIG